MLRANGEDIKVQQDLMRHADIRTTMNLYTQAASEQKRQAQGRVVQLVLPATKNVTLTDPRAVCKLLIQTRRLVGAIGFEPMTSTV